MSKVLKIDFVLIDDEIQFLHSLADSNFGCYYSRLALLIMLSTVRSERGGLPQNFAK